MRESPHNEIPLSHGNFKITIKTYKKQSRKKSLTKFCKSHSPIDFFVQLPGREEKYELEIIVIVKKSSINFAPLDNPTEPHPLNSTSNDAITECVSMVPTNFQVSRYNNVTEKLTEKQVSNRNLPPAIQKSQKEYFGNSA